MPDGAENFMITVFRLYSRKIVVRLPTIYKQEFSSCTIYHFVPDALYVFSYSIIQFTLLVSKNDFAKTETSPRTFHEQALNTAHKE